MIPQSHKKFAQEYGYLLAVFVIILALCLVIGAQILFQLSSTIPANEIPPNTLTFTPLSLALSQATNTNLTYNASFPSIIIPNPEIGNHRQHYVYIPIQAANLTVADYIQQYAPVALQDWLVQTQVIGKNISNVYTARGQIEYANLGHILEHYNNNLSVYEENTTNPMGLVVPGLSKQGIYDRGFEQHIRLLQ